MNLLRISQSATWPLAYAYFNSLYNVRISGRENLRKVTAPFIIAVNHVGFLDSFMFRLILGLRTPHLPLRFMGVNKFDWKRLNFLNEAGIIPFIYGLFGVFTVTPGLGLAKNLEEAGRIIAGKGVVVIYPEGKIGMAGTVAPFRRGAAVLASETGAPIMPVSFRLGRRGFPRRPFTVNIGELIRVPAGADPDKITESLRNAVVSLYDKEPAAVKKAAEAPLVASVSPPMSAEEQKRHA